jgi:N-acetylglucosaminyldiphosphoundecaprenol N-acetyl-beta-D-mannosaminyltransferase
MLTNDPSIDEKVHDDGKIMEIKVNSSSTSSLLARVEKLIPDSVGQSATRRKFYIVTPNPELILMAQKNISLKNALNSADFAVPDGVGLKIANPKLKIIKGRELFLDLIRLSNKNHWKVFLLGGLGEEAGLTASKLKNLYPNIEIDYHKGVILNSDANPETRSDRELEKEVMNRINKFAPNLLFVAFGNPKQEIWIHKNLDELKIGGAMAVGGTFRYVSGISSLPPKWMEKIGLEWLWRGLTEPSRIGRVINAVLVFPIKVLLYKPVTK